MQALEEVFTALSEWIYVSIKLALGMGIDF